MSIIKRLRAEIKEREEQIEEIQESCPHPEPALTRKETTAPVTVHYEDEIGAQTSTEYRAAVHHSCGLCDSTWIRLEDGRLWNQFLQDNIGRI